MLVLICLVYCNGGLQWEGGSRKRERERDEVKVQSCSQGLNLKTIWNSIHVESMFKVLREAYRQYFVSYFIFDWLSSSSTKTRSDSLNVLWLKFSLKWLLFELMIDHFMIHKLHRHRCPPLLIQFIHNLFILNDESYIK